MKSKKPEILRRTIVSRELSEICGNPDLNGQLISASPLPSGGNRLFFSNNTGHLLALDGTKGVIGARIVSGAPRVDVSATPNAGAALPIPGCTATVEPDLNEPELLQGRDVLFGHSNHMAPKTICDWLVWHVRHHKANAALILDRSQPDRADKLASALSKHLSKAMKTAPDIARPLSQLKVVIVDCNVPLGAPDLGPARHPFYAPDAPGRDRMEQPQPDPWRSNIGYPLAVDLLKQRFLTSARSVCLLETSDLLKPPGADETTVFDAACADPRGVIPLGGERIYPWGLRNDQNAQFSDHICRRFDSFVIEPRWCAAPERLPEDTIWMMRRILGAKTSTPARSFWRFMALRHHGDDRSKVNLIVPKTSLVEDDTLLDLSRQLNGDPVRQPPDEGSPTPARKATGRVAIVTTMKNEGPFILEWLAYHRAIGVDDFLIYTNDCSDGTDAFLQLLERKGYVQWRDNPYRSTNMKPQHAALDAANSEPVISGADWSICMDVDEYIAVHTGDGTLKALFDAVPDANLISLTWRLFGNNDIDKFSDSFITQSFTRAAREFCNKPHQAWGFKTLFRNEGLFKKLGVHRPKGLIPQAVDRINWVNGSGKPMPQNQWRNAWRSNSGTYGYDLVSLNHYAVRSAESFLVKRDRGRVNHVDRDQGMAYWFRMNHNVVEDDRMKHILPRLQQEYDAIIADPEIAAMHAECVNAHRAKIEELKAQPNYQRFYAELNSDRTRKLSQLHGHFGSNVYLAGPQIIPDEVVARDPSEDFFFTVKHVGETQH